MGVTTRTLDLWCLMKVWKLLFPIQLVIGLVHYYANAGERRCFYKELNQGILLIGKYKMEIQDPESGEYYTPIDKLNTGLVIDVEEIFDNNHRVVHQKGRPNGQFTFSALEDGEHKVCLTPKSFFKKWSGGGSGNPHIIKDLKFKRSRITIDFLIGDSTVLDSKHTGKVKDLNEQINNLRNKLIDIKREQNFIRGKEELFRDLSELCQERLVTWLIIQISTLILTGVYQLLTLQRFFVKEKLS